MIRPLLPLFLAILLIGIAHAQDSAAVSPDSGSCLLLSVRDAATGIGDVGAFVTAPLRWDAHGWLVASGVAGATMLAMAVDPSVTEVLARQYGTVHDAVSTVGGEFGTARNALALAVGIYAVGWVAGEDGIRTTGAMTLEALAFSGAVTTAVKTLAGRSRPFTNEGAWTWRPIAFTHEQTSLPSGHATVAFSLATILADRVDWLPATIALYALAGSTVYQRVASSQHWASDVVLGAIIGHVSARFVIGRHRDRASQSGRHMTLVPILSPRGTGVGLVIPIN